MLAMDVNDNAGCRVASMLAALASSRASHAPTDIVSIALSVGASTLAMDVNDNAWCRVASMLAAPASSRASRAPTDFDRKAGLRLHVGLRVP